MANTEHLEMLRRGMEVWDKWRSEHIDVQPDLVGAHLVNEDLSKADLVGADLSRADLTGADLGETHLTGVRLTGADLTCANLVSASLIGADLRSAKLIGADLSDADLSDAHLNATDLTGADLSRADLSGTDFSNADLNGADFTEAVLDNASFGGNDLSQVKGLETVNHDGPSHLSIETIYISQGNIPEIFLRGCGVPEDFITYMHSLTRQPIQFYSCFISYSSRDQSFAERLHADLQSKGVRVWFAPHDLPIGARIRPAIDESIRLHDKLLLVLSEASVSSQWVEQEVETALSREREQEGKVVLFPVRIDDAVMDIKTGWPALLKNTRNVGDFTRWKEHDSYAKAFERLLRDLKAGA